MTSRRIEVYPGVRKTLLNLAKPTRRRLQHTIDSLVEQPRPRGATELTGAPGMLRLRAATYEVIYTIREDLILIVDVAPHEWARSARG